VEHDFWWLVPEGLGIVSGVYKPTTNYINGVYKPTITNYTWYLYIVSIKYIQPVSCYLSAPTPPILCIPSNPWPVQLEASKIFKHVHVQPVLFFWE